MILTNDKILHPEVFRNIWGCETPPNQPPNLDNFSYILEMLVQSYKFIECLFVTEYFSLKHLEFLGMWKTPKINPRKLDNFLYISEMLYQSYKFVPSLLMTKYFSLKFLEILGVWNTPKINPQNVDNFCNILKSVVQSNKLVSSISVLVRAQLILTQSAPESN